ncbi:HupE/UreJ family protein [uncultured Ruegeria sp.]|uniref:HupE/UreJ family protein n=1 Tax=uncultured Ruegeria sp. TaxID=259304 RepID=UPI00262EFFF8|nr:HupE/UreJ family protein [uncultured Ruegeria sp.]
MRDGLIPAILCHLKVLLLSFVTALTLAPSFVFAQSPAPTIVEFWTKSDTLFLDISLNAEAFLAGVDPQSATGFDDNRHYKDLRQLVSSELEPKVKAFAKPWMQTLQVDIAGPVVLSYEGVSIPVVGDPQTVRTSKLLLTAPLPDGASGFRLTWPDGSGSAVIKQQRVSAPYTGYLTGGQMTPMIPLQGGAALTTEQTLQTFLPKGLSQVLTSGPKPILLVLTLVFLSLNLRPFLMQLLVFSLGILLGLSAGAFDAVSISSTAASQSLAFAIVGLAVWNLISRRLQILRVFAVFAAGLLQGLAWTFALTEIGVPPNQLPPAILGFAGGIVLALCAVAFAAFAASVVITGGLHRLQGRVSILASMVIAGAGVFLTIEPWLFG